MPDLTDASKLTLVFDWGNTLMKVFPQYSGPMNDWPEVAEVNGVVEALEALLGRCPMVVATNAVDSSAEQVWKALRRVGLGEYFKAVFTSHELGGKKPQPQFFHSIESVMDQTPRAMVMVGDDYRADILGAKAVGWKAVWYNPDRQAAPGLIPFHDAEIQDMRQLPQALAHLSLPAYTTCLIWLTERGAPHSILAHIQLVSAVAYQLAVWLRNQGEMIDPLLTQRGAMLHDLAKIDSIGPDKKHINHAELARDLLIEHGQPELASIALRHMPYSDRNSPRRPHTWEERLVNYADKLSEGSQLVPIEERLQALKGRYPGYVEEMEASWPLLSELQKEICDILGVTPVELIQRLRKALGYRVTD